MRRRYVNGLIFKLNNSIRNAIQCPGRNASAVAGIFPPITNTTFGQQIPTEIEPAMQQSYAPRGYASAQRHTISTRQTFPPMNVMIQQQIPLSFAEEHNYTTMATGP